MRRIDAGCHSPTSRGLPRGRGRYAGQPRIALRLGCAPDRCSAEWAWARSNSARICAEQLETSPQVILAGLQSKALILQGSPKEPNNATSHSRRSFLSQCTLAASASLPMAAAFNSEMSGGSVQAGDQVSSASSTLLVCLR
jgi:hypothetical protein